MTKVMHYDRIATTVTIIDVFTQKRDTFTFPEIKKDFPELVNDEVETLEFFQEFPKVNLKYSDIGNRPFGYVGQRIILRINRRNSKRTHKTQSQKINQQKHLQQLIQKYRTQKIKKYQ